MMINVVLLVCAQACLIQSTTGQCIRSAMAPFGATGAPCGAASPFATTAGASWASAAPFVVSYAAGAYETGAPAATNGGSLPTPSASLVPPSGVSLVSKNVYEGPLAVSGALPTAGAGAVAFGAGNGEVAMLSEDIGAAGTPGPYGADAFGYRSGAFEPQKCVL